MTNFLAQIQALDTSRPQPKQLQLEPRKARRQKAKDAAIAQKLTHSAKL